MANKRQYEMRDWRMIDHDEWKTLVNDEHEMTNIGEGETIATDRQWEMTGNGNDR